MKKFLVFLVMWGYIHIALLIGALIIVFDLRTIDAATFEDGSGQVVWSYCAPWEVCSDYAVTTIPTQASWDNVIGNPDYMCWLSDEFDQLIPQDVIDYITSVDDSPKIYSNRCISQTAPVDQCVLDEFTQVDDGGEDHLVWLINWKCTYNQFFPITTK